MQKVGSVITTGKATRRLSQQDLRKLQNAAVVVICLLLFFIVFRPYFLGLRDNRDFQTCQSNVYRIARALNNYSQDWDGAFPPSSIWMTSARANFPLPSNAGFNIDHFFHCPLDKTGSPSSYAYNALMSGLMPGVEPRDGSEEEARLKRIGRLTRAPLIIEKHGTQENDSTELADWDAVLQQMTLPHNVPSPAGLLIAGSMAPERKTREQLRNMAGTKF